MAPIKHEKKVENKIILIQTSSSKTPVTEANYHAMKIRKRRSSQ
jgi:hypothetical protein